MTTLAEQITTLQQNMVSQMPEEVVQTLMKGTADLKASGIEDKIAKAGDAFPSFALPNALGVSVSSDGLLDNGDLVINFYRGGWCPYCNLELRAFVQALPQIEEAGAKLVAISPEKPDQSLQEGEKRDLPFEVLTDEGNTLANLLGLVFSVPESVQAIYKQFGFDLSERNADGHWTLPLPATVVVGQDRKIKAIYADADYTKRMEPLDVLKALARE